MFKGMTEKEAYEKFEEYAATQLLSTEFFAVASFFQKTFNKFPECTLSFPGTRAVVKGEDGKNKLADETIRP